VIRHSVFRTFLDNIGRISRFTAGLNLQTSSENEQALFAVKHALLIVSEASLAVELCPAVPWADIRGLGNRLRHDYHTIDVVRLWRRVERDLPPLKTAVEAALKRLKVQE
jgi:uncharacterized protein with HEPN domain